jgi:hypothetical protein
MKTQLVGTSTASGTNVAYNLSLTSLSGGLGSSAQEGDLVIIVNALDSAIDDNPGVGTAGYTEMADLYANDTNDANLSVNYKFMSASPDTTVSCNPSNSSAIASVCYAMVWRGVDLTTPFDVASTTATGVGAEDVDCPSITPVTAGTVVVCLGSGGGASIDTFPGTVPSTFTEIVDIASDPGAAEGAVGSYKAWGGSGSVNAGAYAFDLGTAAQNSWAALTLALRAIPTPPPSVTTNAASNVTVTTATLNGNITAGDITDTWLQLGNRLAISGEDLPFLATLSATDVAYTDSTNDSLRTYRWDGTDWSQVGNSLSIAGISNGGMADLNSTDIALSDGSTDTLRTFRFDGTNWAQVGNSFSVAVVNVALGGLNSTDVALWDSTSEALTTYRFDGTNWAKVGNSLTITGGGIAYLAGLSTTDVAFTSSTGGYLRTYHFNGTNWSQVGNSLTLAAANGLAALSSTDIAFTETATKTLATYHFDGTDWAQVGVSATIIPMGFDALTAFSATKVVYSDGTNDDLRTYNLGTEHGFAISTNSTLTSGVSTSTLGNIGSLGAFTDAVSSLTAATTYYFRAYAINVGGLGVGSILNFTTSSNASAPARILRLKGGIRLKGSIRLR